MTSGASAVTRPPAELVRTGSPSSFMFITNGRRLETTTSDRFISGNKNLSITNIKTLNHCSITYSANDPRSILDFSRYCHLMFLKCLDNR
ncbi:hypothetical protein BpHYR1_032737 [Brachionus plicatilis]|uniref:Uncharacterized protein n=1 Tax=Brachionus plicatilis TaxID=10195 RepID=A0A3M7T3A1_BRAPC|nr:hypothetical protein BpHYR1_032737 [Brachionus plicatilis]